MELHHDTVGHVAVVSLHGDLDSTTCGAVQAQLVEVVDLEDRVLIDLEGVGYMSSAGLRTMLLLYRRARRTRTLVGLVGLSDELRTVMAAAGFLDHFCVVGSVADGLRRLQPAADGRRVAS